MSIWEIIIGVVLIIFSLLIICVVLLQEGRQANLGAVSGAADSFLDKGKGADSGRPAGKMDQGHFHRLFCAGVCRDADYEIPRQIKGTQKAPCCAGRFFIMVGGERRDMTQRSDEWKNVYCAYWKRNSGHYRSRRCSVF